VGLVYQLAEVLRYDDETNFDFVLSFLRGAKPIDNLHATLLVQMAVCHLAVMKQSQVLLKPVCLSCPPISSWPYTTPNTILVGWTNKKSESTTCRFGRPVNARFAV